MILLTILAFYRARKDVKKLTKFRKFGTMAVFDFIHLLQHHHLDLFYQYVLQNVVYQHNLTLSWVVVMVWMLILIMTFIHRFGLVVQDSAIFKSDTLKYITWYKCQWLYLWYYWHYYHQFYLHLSEWRYSFEFRCSGVSVYYVVFSFSMLTSFVYSLFQLARLLNASKDDKMHRHLTSLVDSMTSYTILVTIGLLSSLIWGSVFVIGGLDSDIALYEVIYF